MIFALPAVDPPIVFPVPSLTFTPVALPRPEDPWEFVPIQLPCTTFEFPTMSIPRVCPAIVFPAPGALPPIITAEFWKVFARIPTLPTKCSEFSATKVFGF